jgi:hypothetical protein
MQELDGETVMLDLETSKYLSVNSAGTVLLRQLAQDCQRTDLVQALVDEFGISVGQAEADVDAFVRSLREKGLLADTD